MFLSPVTIPSISRLFTAASAGFAGAAPFSAALAAGAPFPSGLPRLVLTFRNRTFSGVRADSSLRTAIPRYRSPYSFFRRLSSRSLAAIWRTSFVSTIRFSEESCWLSSATASFFLDAMRSCQAKTVSPVMMIPASESRMARFTRLTVAIFSFSLYVNSRLGVLTLSDRASPTATAREAFSEAVAGSVYPER